MEMNHKTEFTISGSKLSFDDFERIYKATVAAGPECEITIRQSTYEDYYSSTTTYIEVDAS